MELITRINEIESKIPLLATKDSVDSISTEVVSKLNFVPVEVTSGTYSKVRVNNNGMVTQGSQLTINDLPDIGIKDIVDLNSTLNSKADQEDLVKVNESINSIISTTSNLSKVVSIENQVESKADKSDFATLVSKVDALQSSFDNMNKLYSLDSIAKQIDTMQNDIDTLSGKISSIEYHLNINDSFDE
jgi:hypothetical protein